MLDLKVQRIVVAGGGGFLGTQLVEKLVKAGVPRASILVPRRPEYDLRRFDDCRRATEGRDILFDLAARAGDVALRSKIPGEIFYDNLMVGTQLLEAGRQAGLRKFITIGSAVEYPEDAPLPLTEKDLHNGLPTRADIPYGMAKRIACMQGQMYRQQYGSAIIHLLLTNVYGPTEVVESGYLMPSLIHRVLEAKRLRQPSVKLWGTGEALRDFLFLDDAIEAILLTATSYDEAEPLNLGSGVGIPLKLLATSVCRIAGYDGEIHWDSTRPEGRRQRVLDVSRLQGQLGFKARTSLEEGLKATVAWHAQNTGH